MEKIKQTLDKHIDTVMTYPNVTAVGIGYKMKANITTSEPAIVVWVTKKLPESQLPPKSIIPGEVEGIPTDVREMGEAKIFI
jgi:hypothetical protein